MIKAIAASAFACLMAGCASTGVQVTDEQISRFAVGETTKQQVISSLGKPTTQMRNADGTTAFLYTYMESRTRASTFIPFVGAFVGGADSRYSNVMLTFDRDEKLVSSSATSSEYGTGTGLSAGSPQPVENQPRRQ